MPSNCCRLQIITTILCFVAYMVSCFLHEDWLLVILKWFRCSPNHEFSLNDNAVLLIGTVSYAIGSIFAGYTLEFWIPFSWIQRVMGLAICLSAVLSFLMVAIHNKNVILIFWIFVRILQSSIWVGFVKILAMWWNSNHYGIIMALQSSAYIIGNASALPIIGIFDHFIINSPSERCHDDYSSRVLIFFPTISLIVGLFVSFICNPPPEDNEKSKTSLPTGPQQYFLDSVDENNNNNSQNSMLKEKYHNLTHANETYENTSCWYRFHEFFDPIGPISRTTVMLILILNFLWLMLREVVIIYGEMYLEHKHPKWSERRVHLVNSLFQLGGLISIPLLGWYIDKQYPVNTFIVLPLSSFLTGVCFGVYLLAFIMMILFLDKYVWYYLVLSIFVYKDHCLYLLEFYH